MNGENGSAIGNEGKILKTINGGLNWNEQSSNVDQRLNSLFLINNNKGFVVGESNLLYTSNGGEKWVVQTGGVFDIQFTDSLTGYRTTSAGTLRKTTDGGLSWFVLNTNISTNWLSLFFINSNNGFIAGGRGDIAKTTNGGLNWEIQAKISENILTSVYMTNENTGYICGEFGTIFKTTNAGLTFISNNINEVQLSDYNLFQNYPNPFNSSTVIKYEIKDPSEVSLKLYNIEGKEIQTLVKEYQNPGSYEVLFDAYKLSTGIYFYSIFFNNKFYKSNKLTLIK